MSTVASVHAPRVSRSWSPLAHVASVTFTLLWCVAWFVHAWGYWEDDSYIHLVFARSFAQGKGFAYQGRVVYGDTSPIWVFLLVGFHRFIPGWIVAGKVLAALGAVFALTAVYLLARRFAHGSPHRDLFSLGMLLLFAVNPYFCFWSFSGMEAVTAAGVACFAVLAADPVRPSWWKFLTGCALCGISPLLRPEMAFLSVLVGLLLLRHWFRLKQSYSTSVRSVLLVAGLILVCAPVALWANYALHAFGAIIPTTNAAKRAVGAENVPLRLVQVYGVGFPVLFVALVSVLIGVGRRLRRTGQRSHASGEATFASRIPLGAWVFLAWTAIAVAFYIKDHTHVQTRYILVSGVGTSVACLAIFLMAFGPKWTMRLVSGLLAYAVLVSIFNIWPFVAVRVMDDRVNAGMAEYINRNLPPGAGISDYSIGQMGFLTDHPVIDTGGITRPASISLAPSQFIEWQKAEGAQYAIAGDRPEPGAVLIHQEWGMSWQWSLRTGFQVSRGSLKLWKLAPPTAQK
jgi:hypothetical protein